MGEPKETSRRKTRGATRPPSQDADSEGLIGGLRNTVTRRSTRSQQAWAALKRRYDPYLLAHARARMGAALSRTIDPEEVVDEAWVRAFASWDDFTYERKNSLRSWLRLQVDRTIVDTCRRERRRPPAMLLGAVAGSQVREPIADASGPATVVARNDRREHVARAVDALPPIYRRALRAVWIEEMSREDAARELRVKPNTLAVQLRRGMELLRARLNEES
jgi:RNA polymerase sigma-70 factor (ECF subfamily)